jgi:hypothetical protein
MPPNIPTKQSKYKEIKMDKFPIFTSCRTCSAHACLSTQEEVILFGKTYLRTIPCTLCDGSDHQLQRVDIHDFIRQLRVSLYGEQAA